VDLAFIEGLFEAGPGPSSLGLRAISARRAVFDGVECHFDLIASLDSTSPSSFLN
jgi:hypothetical protein